MARTLSIESKRFEGREVYPRDLIVNQEENGRAFPYTVADVADILEDLEAGRGIMQAITVVPVKTETGPSLKVIIGYRRWFAANEYGKTHPEFMIPVVLETDKDKSEVDILVDNLRENVAKKSLTIIDHGRAAMRLTESKYNQQEIKLILGLGSEAQVSQALKLVTELPEAVQIKVHKGEITADDAFTLLKVKDMQKRAEVIQNVLSSPPPTVQEMQEPQELKAPRGARSAAIREAAEEAGAVITMKMPGFKKYLNEAIDEEGPGSNHGEVELKKKILLRLEGTISDKQLDNAFGKYCKEKGA
jgi:ParB/RepB/Spo0J family partition protein